MIIQEINMYNICIDIMPPEDDFEKFIKKIIKIIKKVLNKT